MNPSLVVRCQNGVVVWVREGISARSFRWRCTRDNFIIAAPSSSSQIESTLLAIAQHSTSLSGAILQVVEITL